MHLVSVHFIPVSWKKTLFCSSGCLKHPRTQRYLIIFIMNTLILLRWQGNVTNELLWHMTQMAPLRPLCLALCCSISSSNGRRRYLCPETNNDSTHIQGSTALLRFQNIFFLPLKEGKGQSKCHMSWLLAKFQWKLSPKAMLSSPTGCRLSH